MQFILQYSREIILALPIIMTILFYQVHYRIKKQRWLAIHFSTQISSMFYVIAVSLLIDRWLPFRSIGYLLIGILLLLSVLVILQWKKDTEIKIIHACKVLSRILFLFFSITYIVLLIIYSTILFNS